MRLDERGEGWQPVLMNPSFEELVQLAQSGWDTIRILFTEEDLFIASGYGNTHETIARSARTKFGKRFDTGVDAILYRSGDRVLINFCGFGGGPEQAPASRWSQWMPEKHVSVLRELVRESGYSL